MGEAQLMLNPGFLGSVAYVALVQTNQIMGKPYPGPESHS